MWINQKPKLNEVLQYKNQKVIQVFLRTNPMEESEANLIFEDLLRWLWLCRTHQIKQNHWLQKKSNGLTLYTPMNIIDEMWHSFIICTKDYQEFCHQYLGAFIHHSPNVNESVNAQKKEESREDPELKQMLHLVLIHFGKETMQRWFVDYPEKYASV
jgi:hypothetical protein